MALDDLIEVEVIVNRFNRLLGDLMRGAIPRNVFHPWEVDILLDLENCDVPPRRRQEILSEVASKPFALLAKVLSETGKVGIGKVVIRDREDVVLLTANDKKLVLYKLRYPNEVRDIREIPVYDAVIDKEQLKLAKTLVSSMEKPFSKVQLKDTYHDALKEIIDAKIAGNEVVSNSTDEVAKPAGDVMELLRKSIEESKRLKEAA